MHIILSAIEPALAAAFAAHCGDLPDITLHRGSILELQVDAISLAHAANVGARL